MSALSVVAAVVLLIVVADAANKPNIGQMLSALPSTSLAITRACICMHHVFASISVYCVLCVLSYSIYSDG